MAPKKRQVQPPSKNPPPSTPISNPKPDSSSESESGSEPSNAKVKSLASKPMKAPPQAQVQSTPVPARSGTKRPNESGSKRAKKKTAAASGGGSENEEIVANASKPMKAPPQAQAQSTPVPARSATKRPNESGSKGAKKKTAAASGGGSENEEAVAKKDKSLALSEICKFVEAAGLSTDAIRRGMDLMAESKVAEFAEGWRKVHIVEMELFVTRLQLRTDEASILLEEAMKKSTS